MLRPPPRSNRTDTPCPYTPLFRPVFPEHPVRAPGRGDEPFLGTDGAIDRGQHAGFRRDLQLVVIQAVILQRLLGKPSQAGARIDARSEEHTSELQSLMRISYAVFCLKKKTTYITTNTVRKK